MNDEQQARLWGVSGLLAHAEARPEVAFHAFSRAAEHAERAGAVLEEATYLTGIAAAASNRGALEVALDAAERATLLFEHLGRGKEAARAALARTAGFAMIGAESELRTAGDDALRRARLENDVTCQGYVHLAFADGFTSNPREAGEHAQRAAHLLSSGSDDDRLRAGARLLVHRQTTDVAALDALARRDVSPEARLDWWGARARAFAEGRREGRAEEILEALLTLASLGATGVARGPSLVRGAQLALGQGRGDDARRLLATAREAAGELLRGTPGALRRHVDALEWVALAQAPREAALLPEQLAEVESLVRSLGVRDRLKPLLEQVLDALLLWTGVERGLLLLRAPGAAQTPGGPERLVVRAARNLGREDLRGQQLELSQSLALRALERGEPVVAVDAAGELPDLHRSVHALRLRSVLAVPLIARGETQGVVYLDDRSRRGAFGGRELAWVRLVATLAAVAIADARDQLRLRRAARRAERAEVQAARALSRTEAELEVAERELGRSQGARDTRGDYSAIVGQSVPLAQLLRTVDRVAASEVPVLVNGESGSGKELIARALHENGPRAGKSFVAENCAAIPEPLLESTLFGHVRGAFTGALRQRTGLFEVADHGTLFLDEVGEMPLPMQTKLLRVLQEGEIRPVGSERARRVDVRVIAATHRDLKQRVEAGLFREDLFYRLNVISLRVPPLRERPGDIPLLLQHFSKVHGKGRVLSFEPDALAALVGFEWPGNVRQLENEVRRLLVLCDERVPVSQLSPELRAAAPGGERLDTLHVRVRVDALERELVEAALDQTGGNQTRAAELLGLSRFGLQKMMKRLDIGGGSRDVGRRRSGRRSAGELDEPR
jgi:transcriptional regulator with GAF, ATPase, and Fis domain